MCASAVTSSSTTNSYNQSCFACKMTKEKLSRCSGCHFAFYCNTECQNSDWKSHKPKCTLISAKSKFWKSKNPDLKPHPIWKNFSKVDVFQYLAELPSLESGDGKLALDLGCGNSWSALALLKRGWKVIAIDYYSDPLEKIKKEVRKVNETWLTNNRLILIRADVMKFNFPPKVDLVIAKDLLPYLDPKDLGPLLRKIELVLIKNGYFMGSLFEDGCRSQMFGAWTMGGINAVKDYLLPAFYLVEKRHRIKKGGSKIIDFVTRKVQPTEIEAVTRGISDFIEKFRGESS